MVIITSKKTKPREQNDFYPTPIDLASEILYKKVKFFPFLSLDPGCGDGVFGHAIRDFTDNNKKAQIHGIDIQKRNWMFDKNPYDTFWNRDYLDEWPDDPYGPKYDLIIGNPPYKHAEDFIKKSLDVIEEDGMIVFLLKLAFLEGKGRARGLYKTNPPTEVSVLAGRPSFDGTGRTNDYAFALFIWDMEMNQIRRGKHQTELTWFDWS